MIIIDVNNKFKSYNLHELVEHDTFDSSVMSLANLRTLIHDTFSFDDVYTWCFAHVDDEYRSEMVSTLAQRVMTNASGSIDQYIPYTRLQYCLRCWKLKLGHEIDSINQSTMLTWTDVSKAINDAFDVSNGYIAAPMTTHHVYKDMKYIEGINPGRQMLAVLPVDPLDTDLLAISQWDPEDTLPSVSNDYLPTIASFAPRDNTLYAVRFSADKMDISDNSHLVNALYMPEIVRMYHRRTRISSSSGGSGIGYKSRCNDISDFRSE